MLELAQARPDEHRAAFALLYQRLPPALRHLQVAQALQLLADGLLNPAGLWVARRAGRLCGVQVVVPLGGASFLFWLPETPGPHGTADALVQAALRWCAAEGGKLAQAIVSPADAPRAVPLLRHGFRRITRLLYLERDLRGLPAEPAAGDGVCCAPLTPALEPAFRDTLRRSYEGTLDCPELNGLRSVEEVLAGYQAARTGGTAPWWLVRADEAPAGVVILTDLPEGPAWDLSYLGVLPAWRRRGLGRLVTGRALHTAHAAGARRMVLAVDERNAPARRLYESLGFVEMEEREVYLRLLTPGSASIGPSPSAGEG